MFAKYPFLLPIVGLIFGIFLQTYFLLPSIVLIALLLIIIFIAFTKDVFLCSDSLQLNISISIGSIFVASFFLGAVLTSFKQDTLINNHLDINKVKLYKAYVSEPIEFKYNKYKTILSVDNQKILCHFRNNAKSSSLAVGDSIEFVSSLSAIKNFSTKETFDYEKYMYYKGIRYKVRLNGDEWRILDNKHKSLYVFSQEVRNKIFLFFKQRMNLDGDALSLVSALLLGAQEQVSDELNEAFRESGTVHILSVSGLHVSLIYAFLVYMMNLFPFFRNSKILSNFLIITFLLFFSFITGLSPSVVRASWMLIFFCVATIVNQRSNPLNNLFIVCFFMLIYDPFVLYDISFQLSFVSVFFLLTVYPFINQKFKFRTRFLNKIKEPFFISLVAQLGTFPLILFYFGTFPVYFFISNLIIVPFANLLIIVLLIILLLTIFFGSLSFDFADQILFYVHYFYSATIDIFLLLVKSFASLPYASLKNSYISLLDIFLIYTIILFFILFVKHRSVKYLRLSMFVILLFLILDTITLLGIDTNFI